jgi:hypothetical protein
MTSVYPGPGLGDPHPAHPRPASSVARILYPEWGPIVAGAIAAAALALVLHAFAVAIGLSVSSTAPTWRDASFALVLLSGLYVVLAALASYGLGGYVAGLMCTRLSSREDADLRDGLHGLLVWALATLLAALIGLATAQSLTRLGARPAVRLGRPRPLAVKTSSPTISTGCSAPSAGPTPISIIPAQRRPASYSPPRVIAACNRRIVPTSCA